MSDNWYYVKHDPPHFAVLQAIVSTHHPTPRKKKLGTHDEGIYCGDAFPPPADRAARMSRYSVARKARAVL
jgi:hypothetical protein